MTDGTTANAHTLCIAPGTAARLAREYTRWVFTKWPLLLCIGVIVALWAVVVILDVLSGTLDIVTVTVLPLAFAALLTSLVAITYHSTRRSFALAYPDGASTTASFAGDTLTTETLIGASAVHVRAFRRIHTTTSAIILVQRGSRVSAVLPRAALTDVELAELTRRIAELNQ
ncbi:hypothetical protein [Microbacterium lacticum]